MLKYHLHYTLNGSSLVHYDRLDGQAVMLQRYNMLVKRNDVLEVTVSRQGTARVIPVKHYLKTGCIATIGKSPVEE